MTSGAAKVGVGAVLAGNAGNVLEWYDSVVFAFLAPSIAQQFFPSADPLAGLVRAFGVFAVGYLAGRPRSWPRGSSRRPATWPRPRGTSRRWRSRAPG